MSLSLDWLDILLDVLPCHPIEYTHIPYFLRMHDPFSFSYNYRMWLHHFSKINELVFFSAFILTKHTFFTFGINECTFSSIKQWTWFHQLNWFLRAFAWLIIYRYVLFITQFWTTTERIIRTRPSLFICGPTQRPSELSQTFVHIHTTIFMKSSTFITHRGFL